MIRVLEQGKDTGTGLPCMLCKDTETGEYIVQDKSERVTLEEETVEYETVEYEKSGVLVRHFKGGVYEIITEARHKEKGIDMVVYQERNGDRGVWMRGKEEFYSDVPKDRQEQYKQEKRFEIIQNGG